MSETAAAFERITPGYYIRDDPRAEAILRARGGAWHLIQGAGNLSSHRTLEEAKHAASRGVWVGGHPPRENDQHTPSP